MDFSPPGTITFFRTWSLLNPIVHGRSSHPMIIDERENVRFYWLRQAVACHELITCPASSTPAAG